MIATDKTSDPRSSRQTQRLGERQRSQHYRGRNRAAKQEGTRLEKPRLVRRAAELPKEAKKRT